MQKTFIAIACTLTLTLTPSYAQPGGQPKAERGSKVILLLVDCSGSMEQLEDTTQPFVCHLLKLAELSGEPVAFSAIFFGGDGVQVLPTTGGPTAAHRSLSNDLVKHWPKPKGGTPLDAAMQEAVRITGDMPRTSDITAILFTDGEPDSGWLRPEAFPAVKDEVDRLTKAIQGKGYPPPITQQLLVRLEREIQDSRTEVFRKLYDIQRKAEFQKTLDHAEALKKAKVRFIAVDYIGGIPALKQIHATAGGQANDLIIANPATTVIEKLHKLGLTTMPHVVVQHPLAFPDQTKEFERTIPIKLDPMGERAVITLVFDRPVGDFAKHLLLEATVDGNTYGFTMANDEPSRTLSLDNAGNVATAHLALGRLPANLQIALTLKSPGASMSMPACTVYQHLRLSKDVIPQFRPHHSPTDAAGPFGISPNQEIRWIAAYRSKENPKPYPVKSIESVLRNIHTGAEVRLETHADPQVAFTFGSDPQRLPRGTFDVTLQTILESGASITTLLPRHIVSELADEFIALEITPKMGSDTDRFSFHAGHIDFGELGDDRLTGKVSVTVRSMGVPYDVPVIVAIEGLVDADGKSSKEPWIRPDREKLLLKAGRAEQLMLTLKIPDQIEEHLVDGLFKGRLSVVRQDLSEPMPVKRFQPIVGVPDDEPVDLVTFTLRRPTLTVSAPRCLRNMLHTTKDNRVLLPIRVSIAKPFARTVTLHVSHKSLVTRQVTALAEGTFVDAKGAQIPFVRLVPDDPTKNTCQIAPGGTASWRFRFEADDLYELQKASGKLVVSGPGLPSVHITVDVVPRESLLGHTWQRALWVLGAILTFLLLLAIVRLLRLRTFREGKEVVIAEGRPLHGLLHLKATGKNHVTLQPQQPIFYRFGNEPTKRLAGNSPLTLKTDSISEGTPLVIEERTADGAEGWSLSFHELLLDPPEIHGEIQAAPAETEAAAKCHRKIRRRFTLTAVAIAVAWMFFTPSVVRIAQWLYDFVAF